VKETFTQEFFLGCGKHIEECLKDVPDHDRCRCKKDKAALLKSILLQSTVKNE